MSLVVRMSARIFVSIKFILIIALNRTLCMKETCLTLLEFIKYTRDKEIKACRVSVLGPKNIDDLKYEKEATCLSKLVHWVIC